MRLRFGNRIWKPDIRALRDLSRVIHDRKWLRTAGDFPVYYMYRDLGLDEEDRAMIRRAGLRYDITVIPARNLGVEYVKTLGHYHPKVKGTNLSYPELYQILSGEAHFLLQKLHEDIVFDVFMVKAKKRDIVLIPPNYGHVTINPGENELKMANWICREFSSVYRPILKKRGACYFELSGGEVVVNKNYGKLPELRVVDAKDLKHGLAEGDIYNLVGNLKGLEFLKKPHRYRNMFRLG